MQTREKPNPAPYQQDSPKNPGGQRGPSEKRGYDNGILGRERQRGFQGNRSSYPHRHRPSETFTTRYPRQYRTILRCRPQKTLKPPTAQYAHSYITGTLGKPGQRKEPSPSYFSHCSAAYWPAYHTQPTPPPSSQGPSRSPTPQTSTTPPPRYRTTPATSTSSGTKTLEYTTSSPTRPTSTTTSGPAPHSTPGTTSST